MNMFKILTCIGFLLIVQQVSAQNQNYVKTIIPDAPILMSTVDPQNPVKGKVEISYFDGLGRLSQQIKAGQSQSGKDLITPYTYE